MKVILGGVRGTCSVAQPEAMRYGGETTSVLLQGREGEAVFLDAGTGLPSLGGRFPESEPVKALLLLTHYHLDHIAGWPSFPLLYRKGAKLTVASSHAGGGRAAVRVLRKLMKQPFWPVDLDGVQASLVFKNTPERFGGLRIRSCPVRHPGGCAAYRVDEPATGASVVFATDIEWPLSTAEEKAGFLRLCREPAPCRLLLFDGQYSRATYAPFKGWGHSCWEDAVAVARACDAGRLLVIHHAPGLADHQLDRIRRRVQAARPGADLARGGLEVDL